MTIVGYLGDRAEVLVRSNEVGDEALIGFSLPDRFEAIGVFATSVVARPPRRRHRDAALAVVATRTGAMLTRLATPDEGVIEASNPTGWVVDACLRAVNMSTPAAPCASIELPLTLWLDRLMIRIVGAEAAAPLDWSDAVELCPVPGRWRSLDPGDLGSTLGSTVPSWSSMRRSAARGDPGPLAIPRAWASWMDDGMFARWCLGYFPDLASLRADVEFLAPQSVAEQVDATIRASRFAASQ